MVTLKREASCGRPEGLLMETSLRASWKLRSMVETDGGRVDLSGVAGAAIGRRACIRCDGREFKGEGGSSCGGGSGTSEVVFRKYCGPPCAVGDTTGVSLEGDVTLEPASDGLEGTRLLLFLGICKGGADGLSSGAGTIAILPLDPFHSGLGPPDLFPSFSFLTRSLKEVCTLGADCAALYESSRFVTTGVNCPGCTDGGRP